MVEYQHQLPVLSRRHQRVQDESVGRRADDSDNDDCVLEIEADTT